MDTQFPDLDSSGSEMTKKFLDVTKKWGGKGKNEEIIPKK